jgi:hypothetical protein
MAFAWELGSGKILSAGVVGRVILCALSGQD